MLKEEHPFRFLHREDAGLRLARKLNSYERRADACVLGLPRGGVPVAASVAAELDLPLDIYLVRKLGVPGHEELAMGAIASGDVQVLHTPVIENLNITPDMVEAVARREREELRHREQSLRGDIAALELRGKAVIVVDDGIATGSSMEAALVSLWQHQPGRIIVAIPVAPRSTAERLRAKVDELVVLIEADDFRAVSEFYERFGQVTDEEVRRILRLSRGESRESPAAPS